jgi:hypothetical protein
VERRIDLPQVDFLIKRATKEREEASNENSRGGEKSTCSACRKSNLIKLGLSEMARNVNDIVT